MSRQVCVEGLESRLFLSASHVFNATVLADRLEVRGDLIKFKLDLFGEALRFKSDLRAVAKATPAGDTSLDASLATLKSDGKSLSSALKSERQVEAINVLRDEAAVKLDYRQILKDKGNATALAADRAKLLADRVQLQNDAIAGLDARIATRTAAESTISADTGAIVTAAAADPQKTAALTTAVDQFAVDRNAALTRLTNDLATITSARSALVAALTAEQGT